MPPITAQALLDELEQEGLSADARGAATWSAWSNGPGDRYAVHEHGYDKVLAVTQGSITFRLPAARREARLGAGQRLLLPAGTAHEAVVGEAGVACLELHLPAGALRAVAETAGPREA
ncbi:MAG TPA: hypothetical protein VK592_00920 [Candidatus Dormibacteraeota bacterium]|nr:hypothetical protein [Candidatus Dormibacteraeota bacterium]